MSPLGPRMCRRYSPEWATCRRFAPISSWRTFWTVARPTVVPWCSQIGWRHTHAQLPLPRVATTVGPVGQFTETEPFFFVSAVAGLLTVVTILASLAPARRAVTVDPVIALRGE